MIGYPVLILNQLRPEQHLEGFIIGHSRPFSPCTFLTSQLRQVMVELSSISNLVHIQRTYLLESLIAGGWMPSWCYWLPFFSIGMEKDGPLADLWILIKYSITARYLGRLGSAPPEHSLWPGTRHTRRAQAHQWPCVRQPALWGRQCRPRQQAWGTARGKRSLDERRRRLMKEKMPRAGSNLSASMKRVSCTWDAGVNW